MKCNFWLFDEDKTSLTEFLFESNSDDLVFDWRKGKLKNDCVPYLSSGKLNWNARITKFCFVIRFIPYKQSTKPIKCHFKISYPRDNGFKTKGAYLFLIEYRFSAISTLSAENSKARHLNYFRKLREEEQRWRWIACDPVKRKTEYLYWNNIDMKMTSCSLPQLYPANETTGHKQELTKHHAGWMILLTRFSINSVSLQEVQF